MSTRANYNFTNDYTSEMVYIHHDGYEQGACAYFLRAILSINYDIHGGLPQLDINSFYRANDGAEFSKELHGDIEYYYNYNEITQILKVYSVNNTGMSLIDNLFIGDFINKHLSKITSWIDDLIPNDMIPSWYSDDKRAIEIVKIATFHQIDNTTHESLLSLILKIEKHAKILANNYYNDYVIKEHHELLNNLDKIKAIIKESEAAK